MMLSGQLKSFNVFTRGTITTIGNLYPSAAAHTAIDNLVLSPPVVIALTLLTPT